MLPPDMVADWGALANGPAPWRAQTITETQYAIVCTCGLTSTPTARVWTCACGLRWAWTGFLWGPVYAFPPGWIYPETWRR